MWFIVYSIVFIFLNLCKWKEFWYDEFLGCGEKLGEKWMGIKLLIMMLFVVIIFVFECCLECVNVENEKIVKIWVEIRSWDIWRCIFIIVVKGGGIVLFVLCV